MAEPFKAYYSMREVMDATGLTNATIRYWEQQFEQLSPHKDGHGNRYFTPQDLELIKRIQYLRDVMKITRIEAIRRELNSERRQVDVRQRATEYLQKARQQLIELRSLI